MSAPARLSVVTLGAHDVAALRLFYERLGWTTNTAPGGDFAAFPLGGAVLCLYDIAHLAAEAGSAEPPALDATAFKGFSLAINVDERGQVDDALAVAAGAGATVLAEPVDRDWGGASAYFADPEGNTWEIAWLPGAKFDARGALIWPF
jgi:catechol 2,3-dioxygenase-like lactoylglutathione lyase family enzyme